MRFMTSRMPIDLTGRAILSIDDAGGTTVRVLRGRLWITQEGVADDLFLDAGCAHRFVDGGRVIASVEGEPDASATIVFEGDLVIASRDTVLKRMRRLFAGARPGSIGAVGAVGCP